VMLHTLCRIMQAHGHPIGFVESVLFTSRQCMHKGKTWQDLDQSQFPSRICRRAVKSRPFHSLPTKYLSVQPYHPEISISNYTNLVSLAPDRVASVVAGAGALVGTQMCNSGQRAVKQGGERQGGVRQRRARQAG